MKKFLIVVLSMFVGASGYAAVVTRHADDCVGNVFAFERTRIKSTIATGEIIDCDDITEHRIERKVGGGAWHTFPGSVDPTPTGSGPGQTCVFEVSVLESQHTGIYRGVIEHTYGTSVTNEVEVFPQLPCQCTVYGHGHAVGGSGF